MNESQALISHVKVALLGSVHGAAGGADPALDAVGALDRVQKASEAVGQQLTVECDVVALGP